jgi:hypothetical protein
VKEFFKRKREAEKKDNEEGMDGSTGKEKGGFLSHIFSTEFAIQIGIVVLLFGLFYYINKNHDIFGRLFRTK